jgi:hypothetical protein
VLTAGSTAMGDGDSHTWLYSGRGDRHVGPMQRKREREETAMRAWC